MHLRNARALPSATTTASSQSKMMPALVGSRGRGLPHGPCATWCDPSDAPNTPPRAETKQTKWKVVATAKMGNPLPIGIEDFFDKPGVIKDADKAFQAVWS